METKTEAKQVVEGVTTQHALRVVPVEDARVDAFNPSKWSREDIDLIKKTVCPQGIPDGDFKLFIAKCQASGMNPLLGEAFCVERNQNIGTRDNPKWIKVYTFTPGEQGMEARADDFADYRGINAAAVYEKDKIIIDAAARKVEHLFDPSKDRGRIIGAWALVDRAGRTTPVEFVRFDEYYDDRNPQWKSRPATMIVKCARAAALRRAYPNKFDGIFAREELRDESEQAPTPAQAEQANRDTTDKLAEKLAATAKAQADLGKPPQKASEATVTVTAKKEESGAGGGATASIPPASTSEAPPPAAVPNEPVVPYGEWKNKPISSFDGATLLKIIAFGNDKKAAGTLKPEQIAKVDWCLKAIDIEIKKREAKMFDDAPEPGGSDSELD